MVLTGFPAASLAAAVNCCAAPGATVAEDGLTTTPATVPSEGATYPSLRARGVPLSPLPKTVVWVTQLAPPTAALSAEGSRTPREAPVGVDVQATESTVAPEASRSASQSEAFARASPVPYA